MSLRKRLLLGVLAMLLVTILVIDFATVSLVRSFLFGQIDEQVDSAQLQALRYISDEYGSFLDASHLSKGQVGSLEQKVWLAQLSVSVTAAGRATETGPVPTSCILPVKPFGLISMAPTAATSSAALSTADVASNPRLVDGVLSADSLNSRLPSDIYVEVLVDGHVVFNRPSGTCSDPDPAPVLPANLTVESIPEPHRFGMRHGVFVPDRPTFELGSTGSKSGYLAQALQLPGGTLITAISTAPTEVTLTSLVHVELTVSILVGLALIIVALFIVRLSLRPLEDMTETAMAIAAGDLTRRVPSTDDRTEVGRLGEALNRMLSQIESAFDKTTASEGRLRRFAADASHELRTPLTSIRGYAELLRKGAIADEEGKQRAVARIESEATRMGVLVDELLLLARLDQGRPLELHSVDLADMVKDAVGDFMAANPASEVSFAATGHPMVEGDRTRLRQVIDNLLTNTKEHTPEGTQVSAEVSEGPTVATLRISDNGPGLLPEQQSQVFHRFYQGDSVRTGRGSGLGLAIVAAIAGAHGGTATVESTRGAGAVFEVTLPIAAPGKLRAEAGDGNNSHVDDKALDIEDKPVVPMKEAPVNETAGA